MEDANNFIQTIIAESKKLTEANIKKCECQRILKELTLLNNFCSISLNTVGNENSSQALEKVFRISVKVVPGESFCNETIIISVENISKSFSFNSSYWQFIIDIGNGKKVTAWSLENALEPDKIEKFSTSFSTDPDISPVEVKLKIVFSIDFKGHTFVKTVDVSRLLVDVLYLLAPARSSRDQIYDSSGSRFPAALFEDSNFNPDLSSLDNTKQLPCVTQFFFKFDSVMFKFFLENVLFEHCLGRGFDSEFLNNVKSAPVFQLYYQEEEILVTPKPVSGTVSFKSSNPILLCALKIAILRRLMMMKNVKVVCTNDNVCEKLYGLKLKLEELAKPSSTVIGVIDVHNSMDFYLELRDISETIEFLLLSVVE